MFTLGIMRTWDNWRAIVVGKNDRSIDRYRQLLVMIIHRAVRYNRVFFFFFNCEMVKWREINQINRVRQESRGILFFFGNTCQIFKVYPPVDDWKSLRRGFSKIPFCAMCAIIYAHIETQGAWNQLLSLSLFVGESILKFQYLNRLSARRLSCSSMSLFAKRTSLVLISLRVIRDRGFRRYFVPRLAYMTSTWVVYKLVFRIQKEYLHLAHSN